MSSVLNRSVSTMNGGGVGGPVGGGATLGLHGTGVIGARHLREASTSSPLQIFVRAKKKINDIYQEIEEYVAETSLFLQGGWPKSLCADLDRNGKVYTVYFCDKYTVQ